MRRVFLFMMVTVDGFFEGPTGDISWHNVDAEFNDYAIQQLDDVDTLLFGRKTYEGMESWWPTSQAIESDPVVAGKMNAMAKLVFSRTLTEAKWNNTRLVKEGLVDEVAKLKQEPGKDMAVFGSSDLAVALLEADLLDELRIMVNPVILGSGKRLLEGLNARCSLRLLRTRGFSSGNILNVYEPHWNGR